SLLPIPFWAEAVNTACYVQNRVLVTKPHNKTPYELLHGRTPSISFMRPFGCHVTILNTLDSLGKFEGKVDEGFLVGYSVNSKAFRNNDGDAAFDGKELDFDAKKPESKVNLSPSSSAESRKQDDKTKKKAKGKKLEDITYFNDENDVGVEADFNNLETSITVNPIPTTRIHKDHHVSQNIGDLSSTTQTRSMTIVVKDQGGLLQMFNDDFHTYMFACFLSQEEPKRVHQTLKDPSWIEAMQEKLLQFKMQKVWVLVDLPHGKRAIGTKWVFRNKKDERGIVVRNKAILVAQGHTKEEGINYEEVFALVARIEAIRLFLAYASFMGLMMYQMDVKSAFLYGTIKEEDYVCQPSGEALLKDPDGEDVDVHTYRSMISSLMYLTSSRPDIMFAVYASVRFQVTPKASHLYAVKRIFRYLKGKLYLGLWYPKDSPFDLVAYSDSDYASASLDRKSITGGCQFLACRLISWQCKKQTFVATSSTEAEYVAAASCCAQKKDEIFISQDKYVAKILRKFSLVDGKSASTPIDTKKPLLKDPDGEDVDVHTYRSMIGSLMYLTSSRPNIMFAVYACARFQVTPKASHLYAVKRIFRYLKRKPHLGLWYPKDSPFDLVSYSDSDYADASLDRKSTSGGCQFLRYRLISWQCKKQTFMATSSTEAEYVVAAS
nr:retrovirus-related Pol polyprotein from transposon TNT 1-94 [Tanacetum cinerariifolium]